jgi:AcrR family transcriptional regulator
LAPVTDTDLAAAAAAEPEAAAEAAFDRTRRIIEAAYDLLDEDGLEGLTIRAVLKRTGLSRRAFYERFSGKDDLVLAVFEHTIRLAAEHYRQLVAPVPEPLERLRVIVTSIVLARAELDGQIVEESNRRGAALSREHLRLAESRPHDLQVALRPLIQVLVDELAAGMAAGQVRPYAPQRLAALVYNLVSTTVHAELLAEEAARPDPARRAELADDIWEFCRRAIVA